MSTPTPLPCPFCGSPARKHRYHGDQNRFYYGCSSTQCPGNLTFQLAEESDAAAAWNTRTYWQPIATAPKDGTLIDLWLPKSRQRTTRCYWGRPQHTCGENEGYCDSCPDHDGWVDGEDFTLGYTSEEPSHWMPMPAAPTASH